MSSQSNCLVVAVAVCAALMIVFTGRLDAYAYTKIASEHDGHCKDDNGDLRSEGESWTYEKRCELATCARVNDKLYEEVMGCIKVSAQKGCRLTPRLSSSYPSCCPALRCSSNNGSR